MSCDVISNAFLGGEGATYLNVFDLLYVCACIHYISTINIHKLYKLYHSYTDITSVDFPGPDRVPGAAGSRWRRREIPRQTRKGCHGHQREKNMGYGNISGKSLDNDMEIC